MKQYQKILLGILIALIIILGGAQIYISFFLDEQVKETAITRFHEATDDAYDLEIGNLDLWILGRELRISDVKVTKKKEGVGTDILATLDNLSISGVGIINYLLNKNLNINDIEFVNPEIYITAPGQKKDKSQKTNLNKMSRKLSEAVLQKLNSLSISDFNIDGLSSVYNRADLPFDTLASVSDSDIRIENIRLDSASMGEQRIFPAADIYTTIRSVRYQTTNDLYNLTADKIEFSSSNKTLKIDSLSLDPKYDRQKFAEQVPHEIDRMDIVLEQINLEDFDFDQLNQGEGIAGRYVTITNADFNIYRDKHPPPPPDNYPPLPLEMLRNITFPVSIDSLSMTDSYLRYSELVEEAEEPGYIEFANLSATIKQLTNNEEQWARGDHPTAHAEADIMDKALLSADFDFLPADSGDYQHITGNLESLDMQQLNDALVPLAFVRIEDGQILGLDFDMMLGEKHADGEVILRYEDFKISLLNKEKNEETLGKKALSFLANKLKVESENKGEDLRTGEVDFERDEEKSTFNYWWNSLLSGLEESIGL